MRISPSKAARWMQCNRRSYAEWSDESLDPRAPTVASYVGSLAHSMIANEPPTPFPDPIDYDEFTPTKKVAVEQARMIDTEVKRLIKYCDWEVLDSERDVEDFSEDDELGIPIKGTLDLLMMTNAGNTLIADVKTGRNQPVGVWVQLGLYAHAYLEEHPEINPSKVMLTLIHAPRTRTYWVQTCTVKMKPALECIEDSLKIADRIESLMEGGLEALPSPGMHCAGCPINFQCAVANVEVK